MMGNIAERLGGIIAVLTGEREKLVLYVLKRLCRLYDSGTATTLLVIIAILSDRIFKQHGCIKTDVVYYLASVWSLAQKFQLDEFIGIKYVARAACIKRRRLIDFECHIIALLEYDVHVSKDLYDIYMQKLAGVPPLAVGIGTGM